MNEQLQQAIHAYGQAQFNLGVATLRLEQAIAALTPVAQSEQQPEETEEP